MLKKAIVLFVAVFALLGIYWGGIAISRIGKHKVVVSVAPSAAQVRVDGKETGQTIYISEGKHKITASLEGFDTFETNENITGPLTISALLGANSQKGKDFLLGNKDAQVEVQTKGDEYATQVNNNTAKLSPLLSQLPQDGIVYQINSGEPFNSKNSSSNAVALYITSDDAESRQLALDWIRDTGVDPTNIEIVFQSVINPFVGGGE